MKALFFRFSFLQLLGFYFQYFSTLQIIRQHCFIYSLKFYLLLELSIPSLISSYSLEIKTSIVFNLDFASNTILSCFFFFFLIIELYILIPVVITEFFIIIAELAIATGIPTK